MDMNQLAMQIAQVIGNHARDVKTVVRTGEAYIDASAPRNSHDVDWVYPGYSKIEVTIKLIP